MLEFKSVSDLNNAIKKTVDDPYGDVRVSGEISNVKISNKNLFATLKDADSSIGVVCWGWGYRKKKVDLCNGDTILVTGKLAFYLKSGNICLVGSKFEKLGVLGDLHVGYELLKKRCEDLGYFGGKKEFPKFVFRIGIVTSLEGAALQDILYVLNKNKFIGDVLVKGCVVQGGNAAQSIVEGITLLLSKKLDVIIISRGGGSFEDLIAFSDENVLNRIHSSDVFTISAVGHEIDFMLSDFVADLRAPTPSVSGEIVAGRQRGMVDEYFGIRNSVMISCREKILGKLRGHRAKMKYLSGNVEKRIVGEIDLLGSFMGKMNGVLRGKFDRVRMKLGQLGGLIGVRKGVILVSGDRIINSVADLKKGQKLKLIMQDGEVNVIVAQVEK